MLTDADMYFSYDYHLNDSGKSFYTEAIRQDRVSQLPPEIVMHVDQCNRCRKEVEVLSKEDDLNDKD